MRVVDPAHLTPVDVDLVLDLGNSRSTGMLVETLPQRQTNLNDSYLLQIRDLSQPDRTYTGPSPRASSSRKPPSAIRA